MLIIPNQSNAEITDNTEINNINKVCNETRPIPKILKTPKSTIPTTPVMIPSRACNGTNDDDNAMPMIMTTPYR